VAQKKTKNMNYQPIIGLEVHVELSTKSKMFCGCSADFFGKEPNTQTCPVCLGLPGALPVPNKTALEYTAMLGLALGCKISEHCKFDRKNYFYPDLPKGYQISQFDEPLCFDGQMLLSNGRTIRIRRIHQEEDTGKLQHTVLNGEKVALVDLNRSGVPLTEIVTEPDFRTIDEVDEYLKKLHKIIRTLGISSADMEKGSMRLEPSISLEIRGQGSGESQDDIKLPPYRVELKNINSFRFARKALEYEIKRQSEILDKGETPTQQTRGWNEAKGETVAQRDKEEANDYRYFPEPDIPPMEFSDEWIENLRQQIPELPQAKSARLQSEYDLNEYTAEILSEDVAKSNYFEEAVKLDKTLVKDIANWIVNKKINVEETVPAELLQQLKNSKQTTDIAEEEIVKVIDSVVEENGPQVQEYNAGKVGVIGFLMAQCLKKLPPSVDKPSLMKILQNHLK